MKVCRVSEIRELDRKAITEYGIPAAILMENAGQSAYNVIHKITGSRGEFLILCGPGNNGGEGFVIARLLHSRGAGVNVIILAPTDQYSPEASQNLTVIKNLPVKIEINPSLIKIKTAIKKSDYIIDALLGTGVDRPVTGIIEQTIRTVNTGGKTVFAIDIPSGINGDSGQEMGIAVQATHTITFGLPKAGNLLLPGFARGGKLYVSHISFPRALTEDVSLNIAVTEPVALPARKSTANKFDYGPALVIAGSANYYWAPYASAYSFLKCGGGYVNLACPASIVKNISRKGREIVFHPQIETAGGSLSGVNAGSLLELSQKMRFVIIGPGLSLETETRQLVKKLCTEIDKPILIDGDGITAIAEQPSLLKKRRSPTVLTPHTGEMSRLTGKSKEAIERDRIAAVSMAANEFKSYVVLKGPHTLIGCPDGKVYINTTGDTNGAAGMATAGAGDVLNGTVAAAFCLGLDIGPAVCTGVYIHGIAGDMAAAEKGPDGMTATDILLLLPAAMRYYRREIGKKEPGFSPAFEIV